MCMKTNERLYSVSHVLTNGTKKFYNQKFTSAKFESNLCECLKKAVGN